MNQNNNHPQKDPQNKRPRRFAVVLIAVLVLLLITGIYRSIANSQYTETTFSDFLQDMQKNNLAEVEIRSDRIVYLTREEAAKPASQ